MNSNAALAALIVAAQEVSDLRTKSAALEQKLLAAAIDPLLTNCDLHGVRRLARGHREAILLVIERCSLQNLRAYSKKWNPHRAPAAKDASQQDLIRELSRLATGAMEPAAKPPAISSLLAESDLQGARNVMKQHRDAVSNYLSGASLTVLRKLSKAWNPHRASAARDASQQDLIRELSRLAMGDMEPAAKPPPTPKSTTKRTRRRSPTHIAAE